MRESEPARDALASKIGPPTAIEIGALMKSAAPDAFNSEMLD
jgi:hypothetical protein